MQDEESASLTPENPCSSDIVESKVKILSDIETRILGCLIEKQQTTPDQYPLTQNSLVLACNQKSSREPKMSLTDGEVGHCLRDLESRGLVRVDMGARSYRYEHRMTTAFHTDKTLQTVLAVMMLRGPQTLNELFTRTQRTLLFSSIDEVENALVRLIERAEPLVKLIPRQTGQREDRYAHLLSGEPEIDYAPVSRREAKPSNSSEASANLEARIEALESQVLELQRVLEGLSEK